MANILVPAPMIPLPEYRGGPDLDRRVRAAQILSVNDPVECGDCWTLTLDCLERGQSTVPVSRGWLDQHKPHPGGYLIVYQGGARYFRFAADFEAAYTRV